MFKLKKIIYKLIPIPIILTPIAMIINHNYKIGEKNQIIEQENLANETKRLNNLINELSKKIKDWNGKAVSDLEDLKAQIHDLKKIKTMREKIINTKLLSKNNNIFADNLKNKLGKNILLNEIGVDFNFVWGEITPTYKLKEINNNNGEITLEITLNSKQNETRLEKIVTGFKKIDQNIIEIYNKVQGILTSYNKKNPFVLPSEITINSTISDLLEYFKKSFIGYQKLNWEVDYKLANKISDFNDNSKKILNFSLKFRISQANNFSEEKSDWIDVYFTKTK